jgi:3-oxoacyl-[acyl-carrier protein] reductase
VTGAGAADGIGFAIARQFAVAGHSAIITGQNPRVRERAAELVALGLNVRAELADLTSGSDVAALHAAVGPVDILLNNAGIGSVAQPALPRKFLDLSEANWRAGIDASLTTAFLTTKAFLPDMIERGYGRVINITSVTGPLVANEGETAYSAVKAGMVGMTHALALDTARHGITVNAVAPGWIGTGASTEAERIAARNTPPRPAGRPEEVAAAVLFLASEGASYVNGAMIVVNGGNILQERKAG